MRVLKNDIEFPIVNKIVDKIQLGVVIIDRSFTIRYHNTWFEKMCGFNSEEISRYTFFELFPIFTKPTYRDRILQTMESSKSWFLSSGFNKNYVMLNPDLSVDIDKIRHNLKIEPLATAEGDFVMLQLIDQTDQYDRVMNLKRVISQLKKNQDLHNMPLKDELVHDDRFTKFRQLLAYAREHNGHVHTVYLCVQKVAAELDELGKDDAQNFMNDLLLRLRGHLPLKYHSMGWGDGIVVFYHDLRSFNELIRHIDDLIEKMTFLYYVKQRVFEVRLNFAVMSFPEDYTNRNTLDRLIESIDLSHTPELLHIVNPDLRSMYEQYNLLQKTQERFELLFDNMNQGIVFCEMLNPTESGLLDALILSVNAKAEELFAMSIQPRKHKLSELILGFLSSEAQAVQKLLKNLDQTDVSLVIDEKFFESLNKWFRIELYSMRDREFALIIHDITEAKEHQLKIEELAFFDSLTGIPNRKMFFEYMQTILPHAKRAGQKFAILYIDFNRFKAINDLFGHDTGDEVLKKGAEILQSAIRSSDIVARLGGDEFVVLMQDIEGDDDIVTVTERILDMFHIVYEHERVKIVVTVSIGIARFPQDGSELAELMHKADMAMYGAKKNLKNHYQFHNELQ